VIVMEKIPYKHIYGTITIDPSHLRHLNLNKSFFKKHIEKNIEAMYLKLVKDVEEARKEKKL